MCGILSGPCDIQHPTSEKWSLGTFSINLRHTTFFVFPLASWNFIRTEQKPIECKFLALDKTENRTSERKEKEKNKRKKAMVAVSVFIIIGYSVLSTLWTTKKNSSREEVYFGSNVSILSAWFKFYFLLLRIDYHTRTRTPPPFPRSRSHIFARLLPKRHLYYLRAWKRLKHD